MKLVSALLAILLLGACTHLPPRQPTGLTAADFLKEQAARKKQLGAISAKLRLRYEAHEEGVSGKGRLLAELPRGLRLELRDPLGRVQYLVAIEGDKFTALYPTQKRAYSDKSAGTEYMKRFLGFAISFRDLESFLVGILPPGLAGDQFDSWEWVASPGVYRAVREKKDSRLVCDIDPDTGALREIHWSLGKEREIVHVTYTDFFPCCQGVESKLRLGGVVSVRMEKAASRVEAEWDEVTPALIPKGDEPFRLAIPEGVTQIQLP